MNEFILSFSEVTNMMAVLGWKELLGGFVVMLLIFGILETIFIIGSKFLKATYLKAYRNFKSRKGLVD